MKENKTKQKTTCGAGHRNISIFTLLYIHLPAYLFQKQKLWNHKASLNTDKGTKSSYTRVAAEEDASWLPNGWDQWVPGFCAVWLVVLTVCMTLRTENIKLVNTARKRKEKIFYSDKICILLTQKLYITTYLLSHNTSTTVLQSLYEYK